MRLKPAAANDFFICRILVVVVNVVVIIIIIIVLTLPNILLQVKAGKQDHDHDNELSETRGLQFVGLQLESERQAAITRPLKGTALTPN